MRVLLILRIFKDNLQTHYSIFVTSSLCPLTGGSLFVFQSTSRMLDHGASHGFDSSRGHHFRA